MASPGGTWVSGWLTGVASRLRFPQLFALTAGLFLLDLFVPDLLPFADEILLGLATILLGSLRRPRPSPDNGRSEDDPDKVIEAEVIETE
jgi:hypothetical protein